MTKQSRITTQEIEREFNQSQGRKYGKWMLGKSETEDQPAFDNYVKTKLIHEECYTKQESNNLYQPRGSSPSGGGSTSNIEIKINNDPLHEGTISGAYSVNIIDYKELSKLNTIGVGGITSASDTRQRLLYTHGKKILGNSVHYAGYQFGKHAGFTGIKKNTDIHLDWHWMKLPPLDQHQRRNEGTFDINVQFDGLASQDPKQVKFDTSVIVGSKKIDKSQITDYGYYRIGLGSTSSSIPDEYSLHVQAFYSDVDEFKPKGLRRDFQFKKYNNIELMSNGTDKDVYTRGTLFDELEKKVNRVYLKNLKIHRGILPQSVTHQDIIAIEVPEDALVPKQSPAPPGESEKIGKKLLTNNLSEIPTADEALHHNSLVPYFVQDVVNIPVDNGKGGQHNKWCWLIIMDLEHVWKWEDLLAQTEIIYPVKEEITKQKIHLPLGGQLYTLTNNRTIMTCLYSKVEENKSGTGTGTVTFSESPFGANDVTIQKSEIVSIEQI